MYSVEILDPVGRYLKRLDNIVELQVARAVNQIGKASIRVIDDVHPDFWRRDLRFRIYQLNPSGSPYLLGNTVWFARKFTWDIETDTWLINEMHDTLGLLDRRIVAYSEETLQADKILDNGNEDKADNLIRAFVRENFGSAAIDSSRDLSTYLTVESDLDMMPSFSQKTAAWAQVWSTLTDLVNDAGSQGVNLYLDIVPSGDNKFLFRVFKDKLGVDRTNTYPALVFGPEYKNLTNLTLTWDYSQELNFAYVGGDGQKEERLIETVQEDTRIDKSPFNRFETFVDGSDELDSLLLQSMGRTALHKATPRLILEGDTVNTPMVQFGRDYFYGDLVRAAVKGYTFPCLVDAFDISYSQGNNDVKVRMRGEVAI